MFDLALIDQHRSLAAVERLSGKVAFADLMPTPSTVLLSPADCRALIAETETALAPVGMATALNHIEAMLAVFAAAGRDGAKQTPEARALYVTALTAALAACAVGCAGKVVSDVIQAHRFGLPLPGDITERSVTLVAPIRRAQAIAAAHLREHTRRDAKRRAREIENAHIAASKTPEARAAISAMIARAQIRLTLVEGASL